MKYEENEMDFLELSFGKKGKKGKSVVRGCPKCGEKGITTYSDGKRVYNCGYSSCFGESTPCSKQNDGLDWLRQYT